MPTKKKVKQVKKVNALCDFSGVCRVPLEPHEQNNETLGIRHMSDLSWRILRIMGEFVQGFQFLANFNREVTFFGSARLPETSQWYKEAEKLGFLCGKEGYAVITGGGPGIMEAGNKGASRSGGESIGVNIMLPFEQRINAYVKKSAAFYYFFTRKVMLAASAQVFIYFPGGFGTADEFFEMITLIQTKKMSPIPVILFGKEFWEPMILWMQKMVKMGTIKESDMGLFTIVETAEEAMKIIRKSKERTIF